MTYLAMEESAQDADTIHLVQFTRGGVDYRYTNVPYDITALTFTWVATPMELGELNITSELSRTGVSIVMPLSHAFSQLFLDLTQEQQTSVVLYRGYASDPDEEFLAYWKGRVAAAKPSKDQMSIECESIFTSLRRPGLRARYQKTCRAAVYDRLCGLNKDDFAIAGTCTVAAGTQVTITEASGYADGWFVGGMLKYGSTYKHVIKHVGTALTLSHPLYDLIDAVAISGSEAVTLYPGCDKLKTTCKDKFNNLVNNRSFPYIPSKNPFNATSIV